MGGGVRMPEIGIECLVCNIKFTEQQYIKHMETAHNNMTQGEALGMEKAKEQNIPKDVPVVPLDKNAPPSAEFEEIAKMMDQKPKTNHVVPNQSPISVPSAQIKKEPKPIELKYRYEGDCERCNTPVRTIMVEVNARLFAIAYCLIHEEVKQTEVRPILNSMKASPLTPVGEEQEKKAINSLLEYRIKYDRKQKSKRYKPKSKDEEKIKEMLTKEGEKHDK